MSEELIIEEQIAEIDANLEVLDWNIARADALKRLMESEDFQIVIMEGYLQIEADRVFNLLTHPLTVKPDDKASYLSQLDTIKNLGRYLGTPEYKGTVNIIAMNSKQDRDNLIQQKQELLAGKGE